MISLLGKSRSERLVYLAHQPDADDGPDFA
jgi:hypothetical protein